MSRVQRLSEQLRREVAEALRLKVRDPRVIDVVVTGAEVAPDLTLGKVFVQLSPDAAERKRQLQGLDAATPFIRGILAREMPVRRIPELRFIRDDTLRSARRIEDILRDVLPASEAATEGAEPPRGDAEPRRDGIDPPRDGHGDGEA